MENNVLFALPFLNGLCTKWLAGEANFCRRAFTAELDPRNAMDTGYRADLVGGEKRRQKSFIHPKVKGWVSILLCALL